MDTQMPTFMDLAFDGNKFRCIAALHAIGAPANKSAQCYHWWKQQHSSLEAAQPLNPMSSWGEQAFSALRCDDGEAMARAMAMPGVHGVNQFTGIANMELRIHGQAGFTAFIDAALEHNKPRCLEALHAAGAQASHHKAAAYHDWKKGHLWSWASDAGAALAADDGEAMIRAMAMPGADKAYTESQRNEMDRTQNFAWTTGGTDAIPGWIGLDGFGSTFMDQALEDNKRCCIAALHAIGAPANRKVAKYTTWKRAGPTERELQQERSLVCTLKFQREQEQREREWQQDSARRIREQQSARERQECEQQERELQEQRGREQQERELQEQREREQQEHELQEQRERELREEQELQQVMQLSLQEAEARSSIFDSGGAQAGGMAGSHFLAAYDSLPPAEFRHQDQLLGAVRRAVSRYSVRHSAAVSEQQAAAFFEALQAEAFQHTGEVLGELPAAAQRMWTSAQRLPLGDAAEGREFCGILNEAIRLDEEEGARDTAIVVHTINKLLVTRRAGATGEFPLDATCWRGGGLPDEHRAFFRPGVKFRVPMFLATSFSEDTAYEFMYRAHVEGRLPAVQWRIKLDPRGAAQFRYRCKHVNYVTRTNVEGEREFLFAPYSAFTVVSVTEGRGDDRDPHCIELMAAVDNRDEPDDLPLAPWS
jgi:hypothetical protein